MRKFELLTIATAHQHLAPIVEEHLLPHGFSSRTPLCWIRNADAPVRQLFEYVQLKGGALAPWWGFSLDFVPHISAGRMKWHRTEKSALFDVFVDGQGPKHNLSYMWGVSVLLEQAHSRIAAAVESAATFWARGQTQEQLFTLIEELRSQPGSNFWTQLPIANAMCLARRGRELEGRRELEFFAQRIDLNAEAFDDLQRVFEQALGAAQHGVGPERG